MQPTTDLVTERQPTMIIEETGAAPVKSILFVVHEDDELQERLEAALSLARASSAHVQLLQVIPIEAFTVADTNGATYASGQIAEALEGEAARIRRSLEDHLSKEDVSWSYEITTAPTLAELLRNAAFADIVVIGRQPRWHEFTRTGPGLIGELVCSTRTSLCIPGDGVRAFDPFGNAVIAWNGTVECANAVRSSIGLLRMAREVYVARFVEDRQNAFADVELLEYLSRHGVHAEMETHLDKSEVASDLVDFAKRAGAEYLVMGAYSHSRAGEFLFGGVTRELLRSCPITLVMAH